jgi:hypothetical protein
MRLSGFKYFSSLDLFEGYHQVPMSEESVPYTAFVTQDGQYEYLRMPFGLCNAPAVFQRMMNNVLGQHRFTKVLCYLDDLLIPATTLEESLAVLRETLEMLRTAGLTLKLSKCYFLRTTIEYLGYVISEAGDTNLPPKSRDLYQLLPRLKLLVLRICVLLVYRPNTELLLTLIIYGIPDRRVQECVITRNLVPFRI